MSNTVITKLKVILGEQGQCSIKQILPLSDSHNVAGGTFNYNTKLHCENHAFHFVLERKKYTYTRLVLTSAQRIFV